MDSDIRKRPGDDFGDYITKVKWKSFLIIHKAAKEYFKMLHLNFISF